MEDFETLEAPGRCFYVSKRKIWPFQDNDESRNHAREACADISLPLAKITSEEENRLIREYISRPTGYRSCQGHDSKVTSNSFILSNLTTFLILFSSFKIWLICQTCD